MASMGETAWGLYQSLPRLPHRLRRLHIRLHGHQARAAQNPFGAIAMIWGPIAFLCFMALIFLMLTDDRP